MAKRKPAAAAEAAASTATATSAGEYRVVAIDEVVVPEGANPRRTFDAEALAELTESVRQYGILEPLVVRPAAGGGFELVAGERRLRAAREAGLATVPVVVRELSDAQADELRLVENLQRQDLNPVEEAEALRRLLERHGYTQEQLTARLGKSQPWISNRLRLLELPEEVRDLISRGMLSAAAGRELLRLAEHPDRLRALATRAAQHGWTTRQLEQHVDWELQALEWERRRAEEERRRQEEDPKKRARREAELAARRAEWEERLRERLREEELERARHAAVIAAVVDHLAPRAESPVLWAVLAGVSVARGYGRENLHRLYRLAGLEPPQISSLVYPVDSEALVRVVGALAGSSVPVAELRKLTVRSLLEHHWAGALVDVLYEALPPKARAQVDERVERARAREAAAADG